MIRKEQRCDKALIVITIVSLFLFFWALASCTPQAKLNRLAKKHPELFQQDTLKITDTVVIKKDRIDTVFKAGKDTTVFTKGRLIIKHHYDTLTKYTYINGECKDTTVTVTKTVVVQKAVIKPCDCKSKIPWWIYVVIIALVLGIIFKK